MFNLLLETSSERGIAAILDRGSLLYLKELPYGLNNSKYLVPAIQEGFEKLKISAKDLAYIGVGIGPGSYTGIRVGAMTAKAMAYASKIPLVGICTLACFRPNIDCHFAAILDAKIGGAYFLKGVCKNETVTYTSQPQVCELASIGKHLQDVQVLVTPNSKILRPKMEVQYPAMSWEWQEKAPDPVQMGRIALDKFQKGEVSLDGRLELMYLRKTQAEMEKEHRKSEDRSQNEQ